MDCFVCPCGIDLSITPECCNLIWDMCFWCSLFSPTLGASLLQSAITKSVFHFIAWDSTQTGISCAVAKAYFLLSECIDFPWLRNFGYDWYNNLRPYYTSQLIALAMATELQQLLSALFHTGNQYSVGCCRGRVLYWERGTWEWDLDLVSGN